MKRSRVYLILVLANLFWAGNFIVGHFVVTEISALQLTTFRWALGLVLLIPLAIVIERPDWRAALREWPRHLLLALLGPLAFNLLNYEALRFTTAINVALIGALSPALIAVLAALIARDRLRASAIGGIALSLFGVLLILTRGDPGTLFGAGVNVGELLMLAAVVCWGFYTVLGRRNGTPPITATAIQAALTVLMLSPFLAASGVTWSMSAEATWGLVFIVVFPTVAAFVLWNTAVKDVGAARSGVFLNLLPVFTAAIGLALGGSIGLIQILGGALVITGVWLTNRQPRTSIATVD